MDFSIRGWKKNPNLWKLNPVYNQEQSFIDKISVADPERLDADPI